MQFHKKFLSRILLFFGITVLLIAVIYGTYQKSQDFPVSTWEALLEAMKEGDFEELQNLSTDKGYGSLMQSDKVRINKIILREYAILWAEHEVEWTRLDDNTVEAKLGSPYRVTRYIFVRDLYSWKLDEFKPTW